MNERTDAPLLSGKPLDPNSAAAKQYGFKPDTLMAMPPELLQGGGLTAGAGGAGGDGEPTAAAAAFEVEATGEALVNRDVVKLFDGSPFKGVVSQYDENAGFYRVRYEDGDEVGAAAAAAARPLRHFTSHAHHTFFFLNPPFSFFFLNLSRCERNGTGDPGTRRSWRLRS